jgi:hypothetical protein
MTCSLTSRISHARGRQPQSRVHLRRDRRPATQPMAQFPDIRTLARVDLPLLTTHASLQNT